MNRITTKTSAAIVMTSDSVTTGIVEQLLVCSRYPPRCRPQDTLARKACGSRTGSLGPAWGLSLCGDVLHRKLFVQRQVQLQHVDPRLSQKSELPWLGAPGDKLAEFIGRD